MQGERNLKDERSAPAKNEELWTELEISLR
jgi:hypothetical protein